MKRYLAVFLALALLFTGLTAAAAEEEGRSGELIEWSENGWFVRDLNTGELLDFTGWHQVTTTYHYDSGDSESWTDWVYSLGGGKLVEGWQELGGKWYYFMPAMAADSWYDQDTGTVYLFNKDGSWTGLSTNANGWVQFGKDWYYVYKYTEIWEEESYTWAYFYTNGSYLIDDKYYFFKNSVLQTGGWQENQYTYGSETYSDWYYINPNGEVATGWQKIGGDWYYFSRWGGRMYSNGLFSIGEAGGEKLYAFDKEGAMKTNQWHSETWYGDSGAYTEWLYMGADGAAKTGWFRLGKDWYYADEYGWLCTDCWVYDGGSSFYMKESGEMVTGWMEIGGDWFYFKNSGAMAENEWILDGSAWYYIGEGGAMYAGGTYTINGADYTFADNGVWIG